MSLFSFMYGSFQTIYFNFYINYMNLTLKLTSVKVCTFWQYNEKNSMNNIYMYIIYILYIMYKKAYI